MEIKEVLSCLGALAQETRLGVFRALVRAGEAGLSAGQLAEELDVAPNVLSFHLRDLAASGLVGSERQGRSIIYSIKPDLIRDFLNFLTEDCCQGRPELCQPQGLEEKSCY